MGQCLEKVREEEEKLTLDQDSPLRRCSTGFELCLINQHLTSIPEPQPDHLIVSRLNLANNKIGDAALTEGFASQFPSLTSLILNVNELKGFPSHIILPTLVHLSLGGNNLSSLTAESVRLVNFGGFSNLSTLNLSGCRLEQLPASLDKASSLEKLILQQNNLAELPAWHGLTNLRVLMLSSNRLTSLPACVQNMPNLEQLALNDNRISDIDGSVISNLSNLTLLNLSHNNLSSLPQHLGQLVNMEQLDVSRNSLTSLPENSISRMKRLRALSVRSNELSHLPSDIGKCTELFILIAALNRIGSIPPSIGQCSKLDQLDLRVNHISSVPLELSNLTSLGLLALSDNPISEGNVPEEVRKLPNLKCFTV